MKIERLKLHNFRSAIDTEFEFTKQLNLFVGVNGSGKSTVLDAIGLSLSWLIKRIERDKGRGSYIPESSLCNNQVEGSLAIAINDKDTSYHWLLTKKVKGHSSALESQFEGVNQLSKAVKAFYEQESCWPVITYYSVNRVVGVIRPEISSQESLKWSTILGQFS